jgi:hypothetical protein
MNHRHRSLLLIGLGSVGRARCRHNSRPSETRCPAKNRPGDTWSQAFPLPLASDGLQSSRRPRRAVLVLLHLTQDAPSVGLSASHSHGPSDMVRAPHRSPGATSFDSCVGESDLPSASPDLGGRILTVSTRTFEHIRSRPDGAALAEQRLFAQRGGRWRPSRTRPSSWY